MDSLSQSSTILRLRRAFEASKAARGESGVEGLDEENFLIDMHRSLIAEGADCDSETFPQLENISAAFLMRFLPLPPVRLQPEFVYVPSTLPFPLWNERNAKLSMFITTWNMCWEAAQLRHEMFADQLPPELNCLKECPDENVVLLPRPDQHRYATHSILFHMLPRRILERHGLPLLRRGLWPHYMENYWHDAVIPADFDQRLSEAFGDFIWGRLDSGSGTAAYSTSEPIRMLAHNLDYWIPYAYVLAERRLEQFSRVGLESDEQRRTLRSARQSAPRDIRVHRPRKGGALWMGESEVEQVADELIEQADASGKLRAVLEAVRSHRVEEDFSPRWSYAREDFERKLYRKRAKIRVKFVELDETIPVHGPESEVHEKMLWQDFMALLSPKERQVTVLLRNGRTRIGDIAARLGYANHSPVSKALRRIREKAIEFLR